MIQNIKVDVIYYMCPSDFELEFNLCGCCRMRLLTDKAADRKALISDMSRAVGRSRIAIICGPLFEKTGLIYTTARATGRNLVPVGNEEYGINADGKIEIIENSVPLVTKDGTFGGLIIESGSQAIILLTENRAVRRTIMQTLIHPYIEDVSITAVGGNADGSHASEISHGKHVSDGAPQEAPTETAAPDLAEDTSPDMSEENTEPAEDTADVKEDKDAEQESTDTAKENGMEKMYHNVDAYEQLYVLGSDDALNDSDTVKPLTEDFVEDNFFIESKRVTHKQVNEYAKNYVPSQKDEMFISGLEESYDDLVKKEKNLKKLTLLIAILLGITSLVLIYYFLVIPLYYDIPYGEYLKILFGGR